MVKLFIILTLGGLCFGYAQCPPLGRMEGESPVVRAPGESPAVSIDVPSKQNAVKAGSPILVEVTTTNQLNRPISFWSNTNVIFYPITVSDQTGKRLPDRRLGFRDGRFDPALLDSKDPRVLNGEIVTMFSGKLFCVTLKPGEKSIRSIDVTKFYDINSPGEYAISLEDYGPAKVAGAKAASVTRSSVTVVVEK